MKKIIIITFISSYLFLATGIGELLKVNVLIEHYLETKNEFTSLSFFSFLELHYLQDDLNSNDNEMDSKLPFKATFSILEIISLDNIPWKEMKYDFKSFVGMEFTFMPHQYYLNSVNVFASIWHPPQGI